MKSSAVGLSWGMKRTPPPSVRATLMGGFLAGPLWLVHPFAGLSLAFFAPGLPQGGDWFDFMMVRWWTLLVLPVYVLMIRDARRRATRALERVKLT